MNIAANISGNIADELEAPEIDGGIAHALFADAPSSVSFNKLRKRLLRQMRQAFDDFGMLKGQKRWLIGVSGGKDSYGLLALLLDLQWRGLLPVELDRLQPRPGPAEFSEAYPA
jgi:tRNA 2-thiocytidine biosynthesis protein TtcA